MLFLTTEVKTSVRYRGLIRVIIYCSGVARYLGPRGYSYAIDILSRLARCVEFPLCAAGELLGAAQLSSPTFDLSKSLRSRAVWRENVSAVFEMPVYTGVQSGSVPVADPEPNLRGGRVISEIHQGDSPPGKLGPGALGRKIVSSLP